MWNRIEFEGFEIGAAPMDRIGEGSEIDFKRGRMYWRRRVRVMESSSQVSNGRTCVDALVPNHYMHPRIMRVP